MVESFIRQLRELDGVIKEFDDELWCGLADSMTIVSKKKAVVRFRGGMEAEVRKNLGHKRK